MASAELTCPLQHLLLCQLAVGLRRRHCCLRAMLSDMQRWAGDCRVLPMVTAVL